MISPQNNERRFFPGISINNAELSIRSKSRKNEKTKTERKKFSAHIHTLLLQYKAASLPRRRPASPAGHSPRPGPEGAALSLDSHVFTSVTAQQAARS